MTRRRELLPQVATAAGLLGLLTLCFWLTSLSFGDFRPENSTVTFVLWVLSTGVVIGTLALGFAVFRNLLKLYVERRQNKPGSRIKTKLVLGVLAVSVVPVALHLAYSVTLLNRNFDKWFSQPTVDLLQSAETVHRLASAELLQRLERDAERLAAAPEAASALAAGQVLPALADLRRQFGAHYLMLAPVDAAGRRMEVQDPSGRDASALAASIPVGGEAPSAGTFSGWLYATAPIVSGGRAAGTAMLARRVSEAMLAEQQFMQSRLEEWRQLVAARPVIWRSYAYKLALITLAMLFIALWLALFAAKQITRPVEALLTATGEFAGGHLDYRIRTPAMDELAGLVAGFNSMGQALEANTRQLEATNADLNQANAELDERRRFIDAILESITAGVVSISAAGQVLKFNEAARKIAEPRSLAANSSVAELLDEADRPALAHLLNRARRTGIASREFEVERLGRATHLSVTVSSLETGAAPRGFVVVLEDTTELRRAQLSEAWQEVAQHLAHEIKNPLTPVALAAGRIDRLLDRYEQADAGERRVLRERLGQSTRVIAREVESLKSLVDRFSDLARFPAVRPEPSDLNAVAREAVGVFDGRLPGVKLTMEIDPAIPRALLDPEPFKRAIVNLIDNAAEVVQDRWVKEIVVSTGVRPDGTAVELAVADSGPGISAENREKLFVPHFSTKNRGTGLGLPIVRGIVNGHRGTIRVEDNHPSGSRFVIEVPAAAAAEPAGVSG